MTKLPILALLTTLGCGGATPAATPPATPPALTPNDARCTAPQTWFQSACGADPAFDGCYVRCWKPGATSEERKDSSACPAETTCTQRMRQTRDNENAGGVGEACGIEDFICVPTS